MNYIHMYIYIYICVCVFYAGKDAAISVKIAHDRVTTKSFEFDLKPPAVQADLRL